MTLQTAILAQCARSFALCIWMSVLQHMPLLSGAFTVTVIQVPATYAWAIQNMHEKSREQLYIAADGCRSKLRLHSDMWHRTVIPNESLSIEIGFVKVLS